MDNVKNKTALITGGASGIGYDVATKLLQGGAKVVAVLDLSTSPGPTSVANLEKQFGKGSALFFPCDVSNTKQFEETFKKVWNQLNGVDIMINNAGILNDKEWQRTVNVNVTGLIQGSLLAMEYMGKHKGGKGGTILNYASIVALEIYSPFPVYCASKHDVMAFSRSLQGLYHNTGVRVLVICPGITDTPLVSNLQNKLFDFVTAEDLQNRIKNLPTQPVENVARAIVTLIQKGENGSIWISEGNQPPRGVVFPPVQYVDLNL
ncbi:15-hydroxyprostaglandin dehydrogenase [NAD(+)]-like [Megachile rotundata]|uniref:15-hydroxyprostaglandin dehydrogenase [NAD(+)]-like n=1 Tax=Megachile rotundata TaxID=143995 RepID=UPI000258D629